MALASAVFRTPSEGRGGEGGPDFPDLTGKEGNFRKAAAVATRRAPRVNQGPRKLAPQTSKIVRTGAGERPPGAQRFTTGRSTAPKAKRPPGTFCFRGPKESKNQPAGIPGGHRGPTLAPPQGRRSTKQGPPGGRLRWFSFLPLWLPVRGRRNARSA